MPSNLTCFYRKKLESGRMIVFLLLVFFLLPGQMHTSSTDSQPGYTGTTVSIEIQQVFGSKKESLLPVEEITVKLLTLAGMTVSGSDGDIKLEINVRGTPVSARYSSTGSGSGFSRNSGAKINGTIGLRKNGTFHHQKTFSGYMNPPEKMSYNSGYSPPYGAAFYKSDFFPCLMGIIAEMSGSRFLVRCVKDEKSYIRKAAVTLLANVTDMDVQPLLLAALKDEYPGVRIAALQSLGKSGRLADPGPLVLSVGDEDKEVRKTACVILERKNPGWRTSPDASAAVPVFVSNLKPAKRAVPIQIGAAEALSEILKKDALRYLIPLLKEEHSYVRKNILRILNESDPGWRSHNAAVGMVPGLLTNLKQGGPALRIAAAEALGNIKDPRALEPLIAMLPYPHEGIQKAVVEALGKFQDPRAVEPLIIALRNSDPRLNPVIKTVLRQLNPNWAKEKVAQGQVDLLIVDLKSSNSSKRENAVKVLVDLKETGALESLLEAFKKERTVYLKEYMIEALGKLGDPRAYAALIPMLSTYRHGKVKKALEAIDPNWFDSRAAKNWVPHFIAGLKSRIHSEREFAARSLGCIKDPRAVVPLIESLQDREAKVAAAAVQALGNQQDSRAVEPLIKILKKITPGSRVDAVRALGKIKDPAAVEPLIKALEDKEYSVKIQALEALREFRDSRLLEPLGKLLQNGDRITRKKAAGVLEKVDVPGKVPFLMKILHKYRYRSSGIKDTLLKLLEKVKSPRALPDLCNALKHGSYEVRKAAEKAITNIQGDKEDPRVVKTALESYSDPGLNKYRHLFNKLLVKFSGPSMLELFIRLPLEKQGISSLDTTRKVLDKIAPQWWKSEAAKKVVPDCIAALKSSEPELVTNAVYYLQYLKDNRAILPLIEMLKNKNSSHKHEVNTVLGELTGYHIPREYKKWKKWWKINKHKFQPE